MPTIRSFLIFLTLTATACMADDSDFSGVQGLWRVSTLSRTRQDVRTATDLPTIGNDSKKSAASAVVKYVAIFGTELVFIEGPEVDAPMQSRHAIGYSLSEISEQNETIHANLRMPVSVRLPNGKFDDSRIALVPAVIERRRCVKNQLRMVVDFPHEQHEYEAELLNDKAVLELLKTLLGNPNFVCDMKLRESFESRMKKGIERSLKE